MSHPTAEQLQRFYDGESAFDERTLVVNHLVDCAECAQHLAELGGAEAGC